MAFFIKPAKLSAFLLASVLLLSAGAVSAQSTSTAVSGSSDDAYLAALSGMAANMSLETLASETKYPITAKPPQLLSVNGRQLEITCDAFIAMSEEERAALRLSSGLVASPDDFMAGLSNCLLTPTEDLSVLAEASPSS